MDGDSAPGPTEADARRALEDSDAIRCDRDGGIIEEVEQRGK